VSKRIWNFCLHRKEYFYESLWIEIQLHECFLIVWNLPFFLVRLFFWAFSLRSVHSAASCSLDNSLHEYRASSVCNWVPENNHPTQKQEPLKAAFLVAHRSRQSNPLRSITCHARCNYHHKQCMLTSLRSLFSTELTERLRLSIPQEHPVLQPYCELLCPAKVNKNLHLIENK
jgi:hypothetical protein